MPQNGRQSTFKVFFLSRIFLIIGVVILILVSIGYGRSVYQSYKIKQEINSLQEQIHSLEKKKLESMDILSYVMSRDFVEEKARTELNLKKPDEKVIVFYDKNGEEKNGRQGSEDIEESTGQKFSNPIKWWYYFFSHQLGEKKFKNANS